MTSEMGRMPASRYLAGVDLRWWHVYISKTACQLVEKAGLKSERQGRIVRLKKLAADVRAWFVVARA